MGAPWGQTRGLGLERPCCPPAQRPWAQGRRSAMPRQPDTSRLHGKDPGRKPRRREPRAHLAQCGCQHRSWLLELAGTFLAALPREPTPPGQAESLTLRSGMLPCPSGSRLARVTTPTLRTEGHALLVPRPLCCPFPQHNVAASLDLGSAEESLLQWCSPGWAFYPLAPLHQACGPGCSRLLAWRAQRLANAPSHPCCVDKLPVQPDLFLCSGAVERGLQVQLPEMSSWADVHTGPTRDPGKSLAAPSL